MKTHTPIAIQILHVTKEYSIHHEKPTLVEKFYASANGKKEERFVALNDVSLTIRKGERVGIVGANGSGKTTLLKIIVGITAPTTGAVTTCGNVVSLIDLEAGFHPDLTGYQNIFLNGMLLGMDRQEIERKLRSIIAFADICQFIDAPMFTYSSGMALRLGFAIAVHADPDILLLDENMRAGDARFQKKSQATLKEFFKKRKTLVTVTHNLDFAYKMCERILYMNHGKIIHDGGRDVLHMYDKQWKR